MNDWNAVLTDLRKQLVLGQRLANAVLTDIDAVRWEGFTTNRDRLVTLARRVKEGSSDGSS